MADLGITSDVQYESYIRRKGKQRLPVRNPAPLATPEALNQSWSVDFMLMR